MTEIFNNILNLLTYNEAEPFFFNSGLFLFLFLLLTTGYALLSGRRTQSVRLFYLTLFSYYFYYKNAGSYCCLLAVITVGNYYVGRLIESASSPLRKKLWVSLAV